MLFRLLIWAIIVYLAYKAIKAILSSGRDKNRQAVNGRTNSTSADFSDQKIEEAKFWEIKKK